MTDSLLTPETNFTVRESQLVNFIAGFALLAVVIVSLMAYQVDMSITLMLLPAAFFIFRGLSNQVAIAINKKGIYQGSTQLTNWNNFIHAYLIDEQKIGSIQDNFAIVVEYKKDGQPGYFKRKIRITSTQDKTDEEILEAIRFFNSLS
jgi:hypothetical protein